MSQSISHGGAAASSLAVTGTVPAQGAFALGFLHGLASDKVEMSKDGSAAVAFRRDMKTQLFRVQERFELHELWRGMSASCGCVQDSRGNLAYRASPVSAIVELPSGQLRVWRSAWWREIPCEDIDSVRLLYSTDAMSEGLMHTLISAEQAKLSGLTPGQVQPIDAATVMAIVHGTAKATHHVTSVSGVDLTFAQLARASRLKSGLTTATCTAKGGVSRTLVQAWRIPGIGDVNFSREVDVTNVHVHLALLEEVMRQMQGKHGAWPVEDLARIVEPWARVCSPESLRLAVQQIKADIEPGGEMRLCIALGCSPQGLIKVCEAIDRVQAGGATFGQLAA